MSNELITREETRIQAERLTIIEHRIRDNMNRVAESALDIGRCLNQAKDEKLVPHGQWQEWVRQHTGMSPRAAQYVMKAAREIPQTSALAHLEFSKVQALLTLPPEERETFAEEVDAENKSVRELREAIAAKEAAERAQEEERQRRIEAETSLRNRDAQAAAERNQLLQEMADMRDKQAAPEVDAEAQAEIQRLRAEIEDQEAEIMRRAAAQKKASDELLALRTQVARGYISNSNGDNLSPEELGEITAAFIGRAAVLPHMRAHLATCDHNTRGAYRAHVEMVADWCERAMRALDTIDGEVIEL